MKILFSRCLIVGFPLEGCWLWDNGLRLKPSNGHYQIKIYIPEAE